MWFGPLLEEYFCWLKTVRPEKGSKLDEAVRYSLNQKEQLTASWRHLRFRLAIIWQRTPSAPSCWAERIGCSATASRERSPAPLYIRWWETAKANGVEPYEYLLLVLSRLPYYGKTPSTKSWSA